MQTNKPLSMVKTDFFLTKIIVADDDISVRTRVRQKLEDVPGISIVGEASSDQEILQIVGQLKPNLVLMDIKMLKLANLVMIHQLITLNPNIKIIIITPCETDIFFARIMKAGVWGYLTQNVSQGEMLNAIKHVNAGKRYISPEVAKRWALKSGANTEDFALDELSDRELLVAVMLANDIKISDIAKKLNLRANLINHYRRSVLKKLNINTDRELIHLMLRHKLVDSKKLPSVVCYQ